MGTATGGTFVFSFVGARASGDGTDVGVISLALGSDNDDVDGDCVFGAFVGSSVGDPIFGSMFSFVGARDSGCATDEGVVGPGDMNTEGD